HAHRTSAADRDQDRRQQAQSLYGWRQVKQGRTENREENQGPMQRTKSSGQHPGLDAIAEIPFAERPEAVERTHPATPALADAAADDRRVRAKTGAMMYRLPGICFLSRRAALTQFPSSAHHV